MATKRRVLTDEEMGDANRLRSVIESSGLTQEAVGNSCGWASGQAAVQAYLAGRTPLNLDAAFRFAKALNVPLDAISPRLAAKAVELFGATQAGQGAPQTIDGLLLTLKDDIAGADQNVRLAVASLIKTYEKNPQEGERIAKAILALVGQT